MLKSTLILAAIMLSTSAIAHAQEQEKSGGTGTPKPVVAAPMPSTEPAKLTVAQVIYITQAITSLDSHMTGEKDARGNALTAPNNFQFPGSAIWTFARIEKLGTDIVNNYNTALTNERAKLALAKPDDKKALDNFQKAVADMLNAAAYIDLPHVKRKDLCLAATVADCSLTPPVKNAIPISALSLLMPVIDDN